MTHTHADTWEARNIAAEKMAYAESQNGLLHKATDAGYSAALVGMVYIMGAVFAAALVYFIIGLF